MKKYAAFNKTLVAVDANELDEISNSKPAGFYTDDEGMEIYAVEIDRFSGDLTPRLLPTLTLPNSFLEDFLDMALKATAEFEAEYKKKIYSVDDVEKFDDHAKFSESVMLGFDEFKRLTGLAQEDAARTMVHIINEYSDSYSSGDFIYKGFTAQL